MLGAALWLANSAGCALLDSASSSANDAGSAAPSDAAGDDAAPADAGTDARPPLFPGQASYPVQGARALATGDVTGDGTADVLVAIDTGQLLVAKNGGAPEELVMVLPFAPRHLHTADVNGNFKTDLIGASGTQLLLLLDVVDGGHTPVTFDLEPPLIFADSIVDVTASDLDKDGRVDLVMATNNGGVVVLFQDAGGSGQFTSAPVPLMFTHQDSAGQVAVFDRDRDGANDILMVEPFASPQRISLLRQTATPGKFAAAQTFFAAEAPVLTADSDILIADVDANQRGDVLYSSTAGAGLVTLDEGGQPVLTALPAPPSSGFMVLAAGDADADGLLEVALAGEQVAVWRQLTPRSFRPDPEILAPGYTVRQMAMADLDADGCADVATLGVSTLTLFLTRP